MPSSGCRITDTESPHLMLGDVKPPKRSHLQVRRRGTSVSYQNVGMPQDIAKVRMKECSRKNVHEAERRYLHYKRTTEYCGCGRDASAEERNIKQPMNCLLPVFLGRSS